MSNGSFVQFDNSRVAEAGGLIKDAGNAFTQRRQVQEGFVKKVLEDPITLGEKKDEKKSGDAPAADTAPAKSTAPAASTPAKPEPKKLSPEEQKKRDETNRRRREKRAADREAGVKPTPRPAKPKPATPKPATPKPSPAPKPDSKPDAKPDSEPTTEGTASTKYAHILLPIKKPNQEQFDKFKEASPAFTKTGMRESGPIYSADNPYIPPQKKNTPPPVK